MQWVFDDGSVDWIALSELYRIAPLNDKKPNELKFAYSNSLYKVFALGFPAAAVQRTVFSRLRSGRTKAWPRLSRMG